MPNHSPRPATSGLRRVEEPHPVALATGPSDGAGKKASQQASTGERGSTSTDNQLVTITHRVPRELRDRLKIAAITVGRREHDILAAALTAWLEDHAKQ